MARQLSVKQCQGPECRALRARLDQAVALLSDAHNQLRFAIECQHGGIGICANCKRAIETMRATQDAFLSSLPGSAEAKGTR